MHWIYALISKELAMIKYWLYSLVNIDSLSVTCNFFLGFTNSSKMEITIINYINHLNDVSPFLACVSNVWLVNHQQCPIDIKIRCFLKGRVKHCSENSHCFFKVIFKLMYYHFWIYWVAQSVKRLTLDFGSGHDLKVCEIKPWVRFHVDSSEPA